MSGLWRQPVVRLYWSCYRSSPPPWLSPTTVRAAEVSVVRAQSPIDQARAAMAGRSSSPPIPVRLATVHRVGKLERARNRHLARVRNGTKGNTWETPGRGGQTDTPSAPAGKVDMRKPDGPVYGRRLEG